ncbi:MAG: ATP-binding protein [Myxococcales bacterium]
MTLDEALASQPLFFVFGDMGSAHADVFVNGHHVAGAGEARGDLKRAIHELEGLDVPAEWVRPGPNVIGLRYLSHTPGDPRPVGAKDRRLYLGSREHLKAFFIKAESISDFLVVGPVYALLILAVLIAALLVIEWKTERYKYATALAVILATWFYLALRAGFPFAGLALQHRFMLAPFSIALTMAAFTEFVGNYLFGKPTRIVLANRVACALYFAATLVALVMGRTGTGIYSWFARWSLLVAALFLYFIGRAMHQRRGDLAMPLLAVAFVSIVATAVSDVLADLGVLSTPRLFSLALANMPFIASLVVVREFLSISSLNKTLAVSLRQTNAELATALAAAKESTRVKSEFLANVSHELRTPLNSIINIPEGILEQFPAQRRAQCPGCRSTFELEEGETVAPESPCPECGKGGLALSTQHRFEGDPEEAVRFLETIKRSGAHLLGVVNEILDLSKLEAGRMVLQTGRVEIHQLLEEVHSTVKPIADKRGIRIEVEDGSGGGAVQADPVKLAQVLINLVANAVKFSHDRGRVELSCAAEEAGWRFQVRDEGIGIAPEHHKLLFESFRQVDGSSTRKHGGTGLGLAISKKLVEMHGGTIGFESELGKGSTFFVRLPADAARSGPAASPAPSAASAGDPKRKRVLVVDDEPLACETVTVALRHLDVEVVSVLDPRQVAPELARRQPDLLVLDVMMPRLSGLSLLKDLRAQERTRDLPVLVVSAYHSNQELAEGLGASWMTKPWNGEALAKEVCRLLGEPSATAAAPGAAGRGSTG